jgi:hypothetical protein
VTVYAIHGLRIRADRPLDATATVDDGRDGDVDLDVHFGDVIDDDLEDPPGEILARLAYEDLPTYTAARTGAGFVMRFHGFADVVFDDALSRATVHAHRSADADVVPLVVTGAVASFVLEMLGQCVLHASAVVNDGAAIAFAGPSGTGKTTVAALAGLAGSELIADDVLRVDVSDGDGPVLCHTGASVLRLRVGVAELADRAPSGLRTTTADGRVGLRLGRGEPAVHLLRAVVVPRIVPPSEELEVTRVAGADALMALATAPRVVGWVGEEAHRQFAALAELARRVPVLTATVPWGPGEDVTVGKALLDEIARTVL